jgi:hypothetical protein
MGWISDTLMNRPFVWHNGQTLSYAAFNGVLLDTGYSVSVLTNVDIQENAVLLPFAQSLLIAVCSANAGGGC